MSASGMAVAVNGMLDKCATELNKGMPGQRAFSASLCETQRVYPAQPRHRIS